MPKQIAGNVHWIENGKQTSRVVDVEDAFTDSDQARSQIQFAQASGEKGADQAREVGLSSIPGDEISGREQGQTIKALKGKVFKSKVVKEASGKKGWKKGVQEYLKKEVEALWKMRGG